MAISTFDEADKKLTGPAFSVITPFRKDDSIDFASLETYLQAVHDAGGKVFYVMGYNSRFSELSWEEIKVLNTFVTRFVKGVNPDAVVIVADPLHCPTSVSVDFCRHAEAVGADLISLVFREKFYSNRQVVEHFQRCAAACGIGILIHEMSFLSGRGDTLLKWPLNLLDTLAAIPNIVALKEDAKDDAYTLEVLNTVRGRLKVVLAGGGKSRWLKFADSGCDAWLNGIGVFEPRLATVFYNAYRCKDTALLTAILDAIEKPFFEGAVARYGWHLAIKSALEARGYMSRYERMPMLALTDEEHREVCTIIDRMPLEQVLKVKTG